MTNCIFCRVIKGEIPSTKIYENEKVFAFMDIMPGAEGHTLVIPKSHHEKMLSVPSEELDALMKAIQKIAAAAVKATNADGFNIHQSDGEAAGQVINHVHFHIIPRKENDGLNFSWHGKKAEIEDLEKIRNVIKDNL